MIRHSQHEHRNITHRISDRDHDMEHRIEQLELKLAEQEQVNAALREDIKSLKEIQNGDRKECQTGFDHYEQKKKKFSGLLSEVIKSTSALQGQQERLATKAELQYVTHIV